MAEFFRFVPFRHILNASTAHAAPRLQPVSIIEKTPAACRTWCGKIADFPQIKSLIVNL
jgi:hypothetical protein